MIAQSSDDKLDYAYDLLDKLVFEILSSVSENKTLPKMVELLGAVISRRSDLMEKMVETRILLKVKTKNGEEMPFFDKLIFERE